MAIKKCQIYQRFYHQERTSNPRPFHIRSPPPSPSWTRRLKNRIWSEREASLAAKEKSGVEAIKREPAVMHVEPTHRLA